MGKIEYVSLMKQNSEYNFYLHKFLQKKRNWFDIDVLSPRYNWLK